jgi:hypothetical protein
MARSTEMPRERLRMRPPLLPDFLRIIPHRKN